MLRFMTIIAFLTLCFYNSKSYSAELTRTSPDICEFDVQMGDCGYASCYVPENYDANHKYPVIIALPLGGENPEYMRALIKPVALNFNALLVCTDYNYGVSAISRASLFVASAYNVDTSDVTVIGYSMGAAVGFTYIYSNPKKVKGYIGISPAISSATLKSALTSKFKTLPTAFICGDKDTYIHKDMQDFSNKLKAAQCPSMFVSKAGVDHMGDYYTTSEFIDDVNSCYNFIHGITGVNEEIKGVKNFSVAVNNGIVNIKPSSDKSGSLNVVISDINGIIKSKESFEISGNNGNIDVSEYSDGIYFLSIYTGNVMETHKIIVVK